jgi:excisionase family DNA binding protein
MHLQSAPADDLLTPAEVAAILFVDPKTVTRWARAGKLDAIRTPGGHRRYLRADVLAIMSGAHHSQRSAGPRPGTSRDVDVVPAPQADGDVAASAAASEATADALEAEALEATEALVLAAAAVAEAAERAATAASRARAARGLAVEQAALRVPAQRRPESPGA